MIISIILFVLLFITTIIVKLMQKNDTQGKLKRFNEIIEMALIVQFLIIVTTYSVFYKTRPAYKPVLFIQEILLYLYLVLSYVDFQ